MRSLFLQFFINMGDEAKHNLHFSIVFMYLFY
uniref:Uncharacterized protein n=1 Tax=Arundo donax TaxID=35708 RepID=A0A0A9FR79_ARUDO